jgi:RND family efflux transporter MFP subunit
VAATEIHRLIFAAPGIAPGAARHPSRPLLMKLLPLFLFATLLAAPLVWSEDSNITGLVLPVQHASVSSPVLQEVIDAVPIKEGDEVQKDQVLVQLRNSKEQLAVDEAKKLIEQAEFVFKGLQTLYNEHMGSKEQMLKAQTDLELAKIKFALAEEQLKEKTVRSPLAGIVTKKYKEAGESVDRVEKLVDIVNIDQVYVQFYLDPKFMLSLQVGQPVTVRFPVLNGQEFTGKIDFIAPQIDASSNLFVLKLIIDNPGHKIKAGMRGTSDFSKLPKN